MRDPELTDQAKPLTGAKPVGPHATGEAAEYERTLETVRNAFGASSMEMATVLLQLGRAYCRAGRFAEAHKAYVLALETAEDQLGPDHFQLASIYYGLAELELERGRFATGEPYARRSLELCERAAAPPGEIADHLRMLTSLLEQQGRSGESELDLRREKP